VEALLGFLFLFAETRQWRFQAAKYPEHSCPLRLYEQQRAGQRNSASGPQTSQNRRKRRSRQGVPDRKPSKDTACDTPSIQSQMRGQAIAAHGYPALCSFQWVIQYIGPPFRDREKDCRKPCEQSNKKRAA